MNRSRDLIMGVTAAALLALAGPALGDWSVEDRENPELPGRRVDLLKDSSVVAALIYGEGQMKTYLHVYDAQGNQLTMSGLDAEGKPLGLYPHHRGIFIGWNRIESDLGVDNLWGMGGRSRIDLADYNAEIRSDGVTLDTTMHWRSRHAGDDENRLIVENRRLTVTRPDHRTIIDFDTTLTAERDVVLDGDVQHAGVHYRAHHTVNDRAGETAYLWEPTGLRDHGGRLISDEFQWVLFVYPKGDNWYLAAQLNAPTNPTEELSWRNYGRFGFFHRDALSAGESRDLSFRFIVQSIAAPQTPGQLADNEQARLRALVGEYYQAYAAGFEGVED